jgi:hypothetical protein
MSLSLCGVVVGFSVPRIREIVVVYIEIRLVEADLERMEWVN